MIDDEGSEFRPSSEDAELAAVAASFGTLPMGRGIEGIEKRARSLSRRRRAVPALAVVALGAAIGASAAVGPHTAAPAAAGAGTSASVTTAGNLSLTGWSVQKNTKTNAITVTVKNLSDPSGLVAALGVDGVKVDVIQRQMPEKIVAMMDKAQVKPNGFVQQPNGTYMITLDKVQVVPGTTYTIVVWKGVPVWTGTHPTSTIVNSK
jgi:hypothetical protein